MTFNEIPPSLYVPGFWTEFDPSAAGGSSVMPWNILLVGSMLAGGTAEQNVPVQIYSDEEADALFGAGSQAARMARAFRKNNTLLPCWVAGVQDGTAKASKTLTVTGEATAAGVIELCVGGQFVNVGVSAGDSAEDVAAAIAAAVTSQMPATASVPDEADGTVTFTARNGGTAGNSILVEVNFNSGKPLPEGIEITGAGYMTGGDGDPSVETLIGNIGSQWFNIIVTAFQGSIQAFKNELDARWTATRQQTGVLFYGDNSADAKTTVEAKNSQVISAMPYVKSPTPDFEIAAACGGAVATLAEIDPAAPLKSYAVKGVIAPKNKDRAKLPQENDMIHAGGTLLTAGIDGTVYLGRCVTTYKKNAAGADDQSYMQLETIFTLSYIRWDWNNYMASKYPRAKIGKSGEEYGAGQVIITPETARAEALTRYDFWMKKGLCQDAATFAKYLVVEQDADNPYRLNFLLPATLMKQLFTCASKVQFR